ncbi:MAG: N-acetylmuramoyl-L-alanine amidase [Candidatus Latescibacterota bacterium]
MRLIPCILMMGVLGLFSSVGSAEDLRNDDGQKAVDLASITIGEEAYLSVVSIAKKLDASLYWAQPTKKMVLKFGKDRVKVTAFNPTVTINEQTFNLPLEPVMAHGTIYVPAHAFVPLLDRISPDRLIWEKEGRRLFRIAQEYNITGLVFDERANGTLVVMETTRPFTKDDIQDTTTEPRWVHLSVVGGKLDVDQIVRIAPCGGVLEVAAYQYEQSAQVSLRLSSDIGGYEIYPTANPNRIVALLRKREEQPPQASAPEEMGFDPGQWAYHTIIVDPGHGGHDPGAIGPTGVKEKDVVLDIGRRLADLLRDKLQVKVILTRSSDQFIPLNERARLAIRNEGMLFVSIHTNSSKNKKAQGTETFFLSEAKTEDAMNVAQRENASLLYQEKAQLAASENFQLVEDIRLGMLSNQFLKESQDLAALIQSDLSRTLQTKNRGVKQAGFYVMMGTEATMPGVLVEVAFLSNPYEEKLLKRTSFRKKAASAIFEGIKSFKMQNELGMGYGR